MKVNKDHLAIGVALLIGALVVLLLAGCTTAQPTGSFPWTEQGDKHHLSDRQIAILCHELRQQDHFRTRLDLHLCGGPDWAEVMW